MNGQAISQSLRAGRRVYGTLIVSPSPFWPKVVASLGLDFVFIDTEHIPLDRGQVAWMCQTYAALNLAPIVRIPAPDPYQASMVLDGGAAGVVAPYVETAEQVRQLVGAVKHKPLKGGRLQHLLEQSQPLEGDLIDYLGLHNTGHVLVVNIESVPAMENLADIVAVPGLDAVLIGPHDLSCSLGVPEQYDHPKFQKAVATILQTARQQGIGAGIHMIYPAGFEQEIAWSRQDANLILHSADLIAVKETLAKEFKTIKEALGDQKPSDASADEAVNI